MLNLLRLALTISAFVVVTTPGQSDLFEIARCHATLLISSICNDRLFPFDLSNRTQHSIQFKILHLSIQTCAKLSYTNKLHLHCVVFHLIVFNVWSRCRWYSKQKKSGKVSEFKENIGRYPIGYLVCFLSVRHVHQVYDNKKHIQSIGVIKRSIYTGTYPWKSVSLFESTSVLAQFNYCLSLSCYAMMFKTIE